MSTEKPLVPQEVIDAVRRRRDDVLAYIDRLDITIDMIAAWPVTDDVVSER